MPSPGIPSGGLLLDMNDWQIGEHGKTALLYLCENSGFLFGFFIGLFAQNVTRNDYVKKATSI